MRNPRYPISSRMSYESSLIRLVGVAQDPPKPTRIGLSSRHSVSEIESSRSKRSSMYFMECAAKNLIIPTFT
jgi:hypothetical protein